ncbi:MAG: adenosylcobinamide-phosphate synthase CbiB [Aestuariivita sp.]|nr:adenosylcobinamide-phosphate synthase CbiB [Aestuariivita sp.]
MTTFMIFMAMLFDGWLGEPKRLWTQCPHPVVMIGRVISWCERQWIKRSAPRLWGMLTVFILIAGSILCGFGLSLFGPIIEVCVVAVFLAQKSLVDHVRAVASALRYSVAEGRVLVTQIVGRDAIRMTRSDIARAAIESASENFSDGLVAPVFWYLLGGLPGLIAYKAINTADSMIGYQNTRYAEFGWAAARLDDVLNFVPSRLTAVLISLNSGMLLDWIAMQRDAEQHRSPNAGWPESAMAQSLCVALSGPRIYDGELNQFCYVNPGAHHDIGPTEIDQCVALLWRTWGVLMVFFLCLFAVVTLS